VEHDGLGGALGDGSYPIAVPGVTKLV